MSFIMMNTFLGSSSDTLLVIFFPTVYLKFSCYLVFFIFANNNVQIFKKMSMVENCPSSQQTPSICFAFDETSKKSDAFKEQIPYQYSATANKPQTLSIKKQVKQLVTPPPCSARNQQQQYQLKTEEFFDEFDNNFIVKFEDDSPEKCSNDVFQKHKSDLNENVSQVRVNKSNISEPFSINAEVVENEEDADKNKTLENISILGKHAKHPFEIRKRVAFKNNENLVQKTQKPNSKAHRKLIKQENLLIVTSNCWTGMPQTKQNKQIKGWKSTKNTYDKTLKKDCIFNTHNIFKQTLRSTTLDNWKKKYSRNKTCLEKKKTAYQNIFQKPFGFR